MYLNRIWKRIKRFFSPRRNQHKEVLSPTQYARSLGVHIGEDNFIADNKCWSTEPFLISVGNHCQIADGVRFLTHGGGQVLRDRIPSFDTFGKIVIGNWVYIGTNSLIMPGVTIEDNVLVAAGSVVTKSIPARVVCGGNPARIICSIEEYEQHNTVYDLGTKGMSRKDKESALKLLDDSRFVKKAFLKATK